jgi:hypothetical protein
MSVLLKVQLYRKLSQDRCSGQGLVKSLNPQGETFDEAMYRCCSGYSNEIGKTQDGRYIYWVDMTGRSPSDQMAAYAIVEVL